MPMDHSGHSIGAISSSVVVGEGACPLLNFNNK